MDYRCIGEAVKWTRQAVGWTQDDLGVRARCRACPEGLTQPAISSLERGQPPTPARWPVMAAAIEHAFGWRPRILQRIGQGGNVTRTTVTTTTATIR